MRNTRNSLKLAGFGLLTLLVASCNTIAGAGKDIKAGGDAVENTAQDAQDEMTDSDSD